MADLVHCLACDGMGVVYVMQPGPDLDEREFECRQCGGAGLATPPVEPSPEMVRLHGRSMAAGMANLTEEDLRDG